MDWLLASLNTPYLAMFKDAKNEPAKRAADYAAQCADLVAQLKILEGHIAGEVVFRARQADLADIALSAIVKRCLEFPIERPDLPELIRWMKAIDAAGLRGCNRRQADGTDDRRMRRMRR